MSGLWRKHGIAGGKYLVQRRDGTVPEWPNFVIGAADPAAPEALRAYARKAGELGFDVTYVKDIYDLADDFERWRIINKTGDPDAPRHRADDPTIVEKMTAAFNSKEANHD